MSSILYKIFPVVLHDDHTVCCFFPIKTSRNEKNALQALHAGCSKAEPKISPRRRPPSRGCGMAKI